MVPRFHHLCFIPWFYCHQCYMTSTASNLHGFNDQFVYSHKWVIWWVIDMIFIMEWFLANKNPEIQIFNNLDYGFWPFGGHKVSKLFFSYCQNFWIDRFFLIWIFPWKFGFFPGNPDFWKFFLLLWYTCNWHPESTKVPNFLRNCLIKLQEKSSRYKDSRLWRSGNIDEIKNKWNSNGGTLEPCS